MALIAPSILSADFTNISKDFDIMNKNQVDYIHVDVMDGHYVPNITFGPPLIKQFRKLTDIPFDVHLMIENPERYIDDFIDAGADIITFHGDSTIHVNRVINQIKEKNVKVGISLNPGESLEVLDYVIEDLDLVLIMSVNPGFGGQSFIKSSLRKIESLRSLIEKRNLKTEIEVDGGVKLSNAQEILNAGADILVAGSAVFGSENPGEVIKEFKTLNRINRWKDY